ncbi:MAG: DUF1906 domain-containing protein [Micromonosporaceae bacterium]|nr:DUF1906 domain-containing protein [Micromonosporaceae bacterium]
MPAIPGRRRGRLRLRLLALLLVPLTAAAAPAAAPRAAHASVGISQHRGLDTCSAPTVAQMQAFWNNTPFWNIGIYIGGQLRGCAQPNLTSSWLQQVGPNGIGWQFLPIWVGPQAPCSGFQTTFAWDPGTAYQQGRNEALAAYRTAVNLGMSVQDAPITYDLEAFNSADPNCVSAAQWFIQGWVDQLHVPVAQLAGVYGSSCASALAAFASLNPAPDYIWAANWDNNPSTQSLSCVSSGLWSNHQRHKQYAGGHNETWNGVTLNVDSDCSDGPVYPGPDSLSTVDGCTAAAAAVTDAALVAPNFGWALRNGRLLGSRDGGGTWTDLTPAAAGSLQAAFFHDPAHGWVAWAQNGTLYVARTVDGGHLWQTSAMPEMADVASVRLAFGSNGVGGLLATRVSSASFSLADLYTTDDGGATWRGRPAPASGQLAVAADGRISVTGGVDGASRYSSVDAGAHWTRQPSVQAGTGPDATAQSNRWALVTASRCLSGKTNCATTTTVQSTTDGGRTWHQILGPA